METLIKKLYDITGKSGFIRKPFLVDLTTSQYIYLNLNLSKVKCKAKTTRE